MQFIYSDMIGLQQKAKRHHNGESQFSFSFIDISHFYLLSHLGPPSLTCFSSSWLLVLRKMQLIPCRHNPRALISWPCSAFSAPTLRLPTETVGTCQVTPRSQPETLRGLMHIGWTFDQLDTRAGHYISLLPSSGWTVLGIQKLATW